MTQHTQLNYNFWRCKLFIYDMLVALIFQTVQYEAE